MQLVSRATSKKVALLSALVLIVGTLLIATPSLGQTAEPSIAFLNPSGFANTGNRGILVSDLKPDAGPGCCETARQGYRLSAWVANAPPGARVFFSVVQRTLDFEVTNTSQNNENSWEATWDIPDAILDGPATLYAYLVLNEEPIAVDEQEVTILRTENTTQITSPSPGASFGTYAPLEDVVTEGAPASRKAPGGVVEALYRNTDDVQGLLGFYTTSTPGTPPAWKECADESVGNSSFATNRTDDGLRCVIDPADLGKVTALGAVANDSLVSDPAQNQSGDAISVTSNYLQEPTSLSFSSAGFQRVGTLGDTGRFFCSTAEAVKLVDQFGRPVPGANMDVHATGPSDQLKFHQPVPVPGLPTVNQAPNRGSHAIEDAFDCTGQSANSPPGNGNPNKQAEHQRFGFPDRKHVESLAMGTNDAGIWSFRMYSPEAGMTEFTVWVDEADDGCLANDDSFTLGELSINGSIGWNQDPGIAVTQPTEALVPCVSTEPSPGPSESPTEEPEDGSRDVSLRIATTPIVVGESETFTGRIEAADPECAADQRVALKTRRPGQRFWTKMATRTDDQGRFEMVARARAPRDYRAVAPAAGVCDRARSMIIRLRA